METMTEELHGREGDHRDGPVITWSLSKEIKQEIGGGLSTEIAWKENASNCLRPATKICRK